MIILTDTTCYDTAVKNAFKIHINRFKEHEKITIFTKKNCTSHYHEYKDLVEYANKFDLFYKLLQSKDLNILSPNVFLCMILIPLILFKKVKIFFWVQGILPEESFLRNRSNIRFRILSLLEKLALKYSTNHIFVSKEMSIFFTKKYKLTFNNYVTIPCSSRFSTTPKGINRIPHSFAYVGGMSKWQCVDKILQIFEKIYKVNPRAKLFLITHQKDEASILINSLETTLPISLLSISDPVKLEAKLKQIEFGFLIREDIAVNHVASPIKLAEYLSCGVQPIMSSSIKDFAILIRKYKAGHILEDFHSDLNFDRNKSSSNNSLKLYEEKFEEPISRKQIKEFIDS